MPASVSSLSSEGRKKIEENNDSYYEGSGRGNDSVFAAQVWGPEFRCPSVVVHAYHSGTSWVETGKSLELTGQVS